MTQVLVTGASGFIGSHCVLDLLQAGYNVRGTLRDPARGERLRAMLARFEPRAATNLSFAKAELTDPSGWAAAVAGCDGVMHVASPVPVIQPKDPSEVIEPARQGTENVLTAAIAAGINKVVLTSSVASVMGTQHEMERTYTSADWSDPNDPDLQPYAKSKTIAEQTAWELVAGTSTELATVNPALVLGPAMESDYGSSLVTLVKLFNGEVPLVPNFGFEIVDVRDVAALHRLAFEQPETSGQRLLCGAGFRWFMDMATLLRTEFPEYKKVPKYAMPDFLVGVFAIFIKEMRYFINDIGAVKALDCSPARALGWAPRNPEEAMLSGARSLIEHGLV